MKFEDKSYPPFNIKCSIHFVFDRSQDTRKSFRNRLAILRILGGDFDKGESGVI